MHDDHTSYLRQLGAFAWRRPAGYAPLLAELSAGERAIVAMEIATQRIVRGLPWQRRAAIEAELEAYAGPDSGGDAAGG